MIKKSSSTHGTGIFTKKNRKNARIIEYKGSTINDKKADIIEEEGGRECNYFLRLRKNKIIDGSENGN